MQWNWGGGGLEKLVFKNNLFQRKQPYVLYVLEYEKVANIVKLIFGDSGKSQRLSMGWIRLEK